MHVHTCVTLKTEIGCRALSPCASSRSSCPSPSKSVTAPPVQSRQRAFTVLPYGTTALFICKSDPEMSDWSMLSSVFCSEFQGGWPVPRPCGSAASPTFSSWIKGFASALLNTLQTNIIKDWKNSLKTIQGVYYSYLDFFFFKESLLLII